MRLRIALGISGTMLLAACQPVSQPPPSDRETGKRIAALENSLASLKEERVRTRQVLGKMAIRQERLKGGIERLAKREQNDRILLTGLRHDLEYDAGKMEEVTAVVSKIIDSMAHMQQTLASLRIKIVRLREKQSEMEQLMPAIIVPIHGKPNIPEEATPVRPVDEKKRKKVMGSVAFFPAQGPGENPERLYA